MAVEKPRPGVEVEQKFRTVSTPTVTPTLMPCVVGVCRQIVDVLVPTATGGSALNDQALVQLPAVEYMLAAGGTPPAYTTLDAQSLVLSINNGPDTTVLFAGTSLSPSSVAAQILTSFATQGVTELTAETFGTTRFLLRTVGVGEFQSFEIRTGTSAAVLAAFGLVAGFKYVGKSSYDQRQMTVPLSAFPDPRGNLKQVVIEPATVRLFLSTGPSNLRELSRTSAYLRRGGGGTAASVTGTIALATGGLYGSGGTLAGTTLTVALDGGSAVSVAMGTAGSAPTNANDLIQKVNLGLAGVYATNNTGLQIASQTTGPTSKVVITGTAATILGFVGATATSTGQYGVQVVDDGNGDSVSPLIDFLGQNFTSAGSPAVVTGLTAITTLTYPADLASKTLIMSAGGRDEQTLIFDPAIANSAAVLTAINSYWGGALAATINGSNQLVLTSVANGHDGRIEVIGGTALEKLGLLPSVTGTVPHTAITPDPTALNTRKLRIDFGGTIVEHTFSSLLSGSTMTDIVTQLNADSALSAVGIAAVATTNLLRLSVKLGGKDKYIQVLPATSLEAATLLGLTPNQRSTFFDFIGGSYPPNAGDEVFIDGVSMGVVNQRAPGGVVTRLRLNKQLPISASAGQFFSIFAKGLSAGLANRPVPELIVDGTGVPTLAASLLRDTNGVRVTGARMTLYMSYRGVRQDVTAVALNPAALVFSSQLEIEDQIGPVNQLNPLALGASLALQNAPGATITALGVDAVSADSPNGTVEAFTRAFEMLEAFEVYAIAPLTSDEIVAQLALAHALSMSQPENKGERVALCHMPMPTTKLDTIVASGQGNGLGGTGLQLDTGVANLSALLLAAGVNPVGTLLPSTGVFLDIAQDAKHYSVSSISGSVVTIRTAFTAGQNDDGFYATAAMPTTLIDEAFAVKIRGASLTVAGRPDKQGIAETVAARAASFGSRRFYPITLDQLKVSLGGLTVAISGFYGAAMVAGMTGQQPPQQGFTNFPMIGALGVTGTNGYFSERQLNIMSAGGAYILVQDAIGAPVISRQQNSSDQTSVETSEYSITRCLDFAAKLIRTTTKNHIGRFNITQSFIDSISQVVQGTIKMMEDMGVLVNGDIEQLLQDEQQRDVLLVDLAVQVPYPCNKIRFTLVV